MDDDPGIRLVENPVTKENMNYTSAALGVIGVVSLVTWITTGREKFTGPSVERDPTRSNENSEIASKGSM